MFWQLNQNRVLVQKKSQQKLLEPPNFFRIILPVDGEVVIDHRGNDVGEMQRFLDELQNLGLEIEVMARSPCG